MANYYFAVDVVLTGIILRNTVLVILEHFTNSPFEKFVNSIHLIFLKGGRSLLEPFALLSSSYIPVIGYHMIWHYHTCKLL